MPDFLRMALIVCPLCFVAGFIDAVAGGGGLISIPAYLLAGLPPHLAMGTNKLSAAMGTAAATLRYFRSGRVMLKSALVAAALALPGAALGTALLNHLSSDVVVTMLMIALPVVGVLVLLRRGGLSPLVQVPDRWILPVCGAIGLVIGFYDGLIGPGTGTFLILLFTLVLGMDAVTASGSAKVVNLASNVASLVTQILAGHVLFALGLLVGAFSLVGGLLGARFAIRGGAKVIRLGMAVVLILLLISVGAKLL